MLYREAEIRLRKMLGERYDQREATAISDMVMEHITGKERIQRLMDDAAMEDQQVEQLEEFARQLETGVPVQYVLGFTWFMGQRFRVNEKVLIPRPETEELVQWILSDENPATRLHILDIGTGSGCIPIMLKKKLPMAEVHTVDISAGAMAIAQQNARDLQAELIFHQADFLDRSSWDRLPSVDIIVSNPPYVPFSDKAGMAPHVVDHEPHIALFVPDDDPLVFYREILCFAKSKLREGGRIYVETHYDLAKQAAALADHAEIRKDMFGKERMVKMKV